MMRRPNNRGIALIFVLGMVTLISALVVQFGFSTQLQLRLAYAERDRLQAEYLARSGLNFLRLLMVQERAMKNVIAQLSGGAIDPKIPLCKQFPLSTEMLRGLFMLGAGEGGEGEPQPVPEGAESDRLVTAFDTAAMKEFLNFRGDFDGQCNDEASKLNLNHFADLKSAEPSLGGLNSYDRFKDLLMRILLQPSARKLFGEQPEEDIRITVRNIADWIDTDELINEQPGVASGSELSVYDERGGDFKMRNGKMATLDEMYLIEGVSDEWFTPLRPYFTIYSKEKINICTADPFVVEALIMSYASNNQRIPPIDPQDRERIGNVLAAVALQCGDLQPTPQKVAQAVESALMGTVATEAAPLPTTPTTPGQPVTTGAGGTFVDLIDLNGGPYQLIGTGRVPSGSNRETVVQITAIYDTSAQDPKQWKTLYWSME